MITPFFKLSQDADFLLVTIRAPNADLEQAEVEFFERTFLFTAAPYFLRLHLPHEVCNDERTHSEFVCDTGEFSVKAPKQTPGQHFPNLDLISELLKPQRPSASRPVDELDEEELLAEQRPPVEEVRDEQTVREFGYGFAWRTVGVMRKFGEALDGFIDLRDVDEVRIEERTARAKAADEKNFSSEHYLADLFDPPDELLALMEAPLPPQLLDLTDEDRTQLKDLKPVKLPTLDEQQSMKVAYSLVDILFSYLLDLRLTDWEHNAVSDVLIVKTSPSLSLFARFSSAKEALCAVVRRALCYCLHRHFGLASKVAADLLELLNKDRPSVLHCLLRLRKRFNNSGHEFVYLVNQLFIDDYCLWIQSVDESVLQRLREELAEAVQSLAKADVDGLDLDYLETEARLIMLSVEQGGYDSDDC